MIVLLAGAALNSCTDSGAPLAPSGPGVNNTPVITPPGRQYGAVNNALIFTVSATDAESTPALSALNLPAGAMFTDNLDGTGTLNWTPGASFGDTTIQVAFVAVDDSLAADTVSTSIQIIDFTWSSYISAQITPTCALQGCHGSGSSSAGLSVETYASFISGGASGAGVTPGDTALSVVFQKLLSSPPFGSRMPLGGPFFSQARLDSIALWILAGAPEN